MTAIEELRKRKETLLQQLNEGVINDDAWLTFISDARETSCDCMAMAIEDRYKHYRELKETQWIS